MVNALRGETIVNRGQLTNMQDVRTFVTGGHATFTLKSKRTGNRYTYKVNKPREPHPGFKGHFVKILSGPDNENHYQYLGVMEPDLSFRTTGKSKVDVNKKGVYAFRWFLHTLKDKQELPEELEFWHEGKCGCCGRKLTVPESIASGIGPVCAAARGTTQRDLF